MYSQIILLDLVISDLKWVIVESPLIKIQHAISAPKLTWHGHWLLKNKELKEEIQINYAGNSVSGHVRNEKRMINISGSINRPQLDQDFFKASQDVSYFIRK